MTFETHPDFDGAPADRREEPCAEPCDRRGSSSAQARTRRVALESALAGH